MLVRLIWPLLIFFLGFCRVSAEPLGRPNIVFILADDLGWRDLGCYGSTFHETPNLDRLAAEGMRFTDGYAAANVCSPTRASILTGKYPARLRLTTWISGRSMVAGPKQKLQEPPITKQLALAEKTLAEVLKERGYATGFIGKWHLGGEKFFPEKQGFHSNIAGCEKGSPPSYFSPYKIPNLKDGPEGEYLTDRLTDEALRFIEGARAKPFLLYLSHYSVHTPLQAKPELLEKYRAKAARLSAPSDEFKPEGASQVRQVQNQPVYGAMLQSLDESVGRILNKLVELKLDKNTMIVFTSDNGGLSTGNNPPTSNVPLRAGKGWNYEGGVRTPLLIKWPAIIKAGSVTKTPVVSVDLFSTIVDAAGGSIDRAEIDGVSLLPLLKGGSISKRALFWHFPHYSPQGGGPGSVVRMGDFKLIEWFEDNRIELYNLKEDLSEQQNLAANLPAKSAELKQALRNWQEQLEVQMPTPNPKYEGAARR